MDWKIGAFAYSISLMYLLANFLFSGVVGLATAYLCVSAGVFAGSVVTGANLRRATFLATTWLFISFYIIISDVYKNFYKYN